MFDSLTYIFDKVRIVLGDSTCPLSKRCPGHDEENYSCESHRGRTEEGKRAPCYAPSKIEIRKRKEKFWSKLHAADIRAIIDAGGLYDD